jgi:CHASE3 domain sensor protein
MSTRAKPIDVAREVSLKELRRRGLMLAGIGVSVALFVVTLASAARSAGIIPELARCRRAARAASAANRAMLDQETSLRAYLLTRDARNLEAYRTAGTARARGDEEIQAYAAPVAELTGTLRRAQVAEDRWRDGWARLAEAPAQSSAVGSLREGKSLFDAYRREQSAFASALDHRADRLSRQEYVAIGLLGALSLAASLAVLLLALHLQRMIVDPLEALLRGRAALRTNG